MDTDPWVSQSQRFPTCFPKLWWVLGRDPRFGSEGMPAMHGFIAWLRILNQKSLNDPGFHGTKKTAANEMWVACAKITVLTLVTCWFLWKNRYILEVKLQTVELLPPKKQSRSCDFCSPFCHLRNPSYPSWKLTYPTFGDDVPFPKVGYVSFLEDKLSSVPCNSWRLTTTCAAI